MCALVTGVQTCALPIFVVILNRHTPDAFTRMFRMKTGMEEPNMDELRDYGVGAQILAEMGVHEMILLTNSHHSLVALDGYELAVVGKQPIEKIGRASCRESVCQYV